MINLMSSVFIERKTEDILTSTDKSLRNFRYKVQDQKIKIFSVFYNLNKHESFRYVIGTWP